MSMTNSTAATQTAPDANHDITLGFTPTAGRLLVLVNAHQEASVTVATPPSGWTAGPSFSGAAHSGAIWYKTASGSEGAIQVVWSAAGGGTMWCGEWDDTLAGGFDASAENEDNLASAVTSQASGTVSAAGAGLSIFVMMSDALSTIDGTPAWSNSFAQQALVIGANSLRCGIGVATLSHTGAGNVSSTYSCTDTGDEMYGALLCWLTSAAAANPLKYRPLLLHGVGA